MVIKLLAGTVARNLLGMLIRPRFVLMALRHASKLTSTKVDDQIVALVDAAYKNDADAVASALKALTSKQQDRDEGVPVD